MTPEDKEYLASLRIDERYQRLLRSLDVPSVQGWKEGDSAETWAHATGRAEGANAILRALGMERQ